MSLLNQSLSHRAPRPGSRIVVAMSGGVDSSVAAGYLKSQGYEVIGISLQLHDASEQVENKFGTCCSLSDLTDARRVAEKIGIPFYVTNMEQQFKESVIDDFVNEYVVGRTPNPCVRCNEKVKFRQLMDWALDLGAESLATGHYANVSYNQFTDEYELEKGLDPEKDQSYFLFTLQQADLSRTIFPVGGFEKKKVREIAAELGLGVAQKPDSQEICFVQAKSYRDFIEEKVPEEHRQPGEMVDVAGKVVARHGGLHQYTIGQRKGIGVASPEPLYVLALDAKANQVVVGPESYLFRKKATVSHVNWINSASKESAEPLMAKIRYRSKESPVKVNFLPDRRAEVDFLEPQRAVTPGQAIVFYQGNRVLGGGWIDNLPLH